MNEREMAAAHQSGADMIRFGVTATDQPVLILPDSGCKPTSKVRKPRDMFPARFAFAMKREMKVRDIKNKSSTTRVFKVANSEKGVLLYEVTLANTPSCTCTDFRKNRSKVVCKHIIFVVAVALDEPGLQDALKTRYLGTADLSRLLEKQVDASFIQVTKKRTW